MLPVCSYDDIPYVLYETAGHIASEPEYRRGVYANAPENVSPDKTSCEETMFHVLGT